ncbi:uncharacterized protein F5891DRAFT_1008756 [Suillus fuscotomentosus]|uniref:Uncharacterized protein n=1 Tax=Suillus fuscotomentosus TaxID=1912939 RepID=A0AAD4EHW4_9AGAM|nr:uncharacterized protein F5891DRAFT_1008756 [Suillus fuscotomentosus]KAG1905314.1 hypothetical protein F5891DRAFT_1008756 [Suillus fuscotomentosus]
MRSHSLVVVLSLGSAALALLGQFPVSTTDESARPLDIANLDDDKSHSYSFDSKTAQWRFDEGPAENATGNLIFDTVHSFLQHWPNTRYRNGHNIVPGVVPTGTLLYHGTSRKTIPSGPEWTATDPEHSLLFAARGTDSGWHLTLATTRPLKILYFDGSSAAKVAEGTMDTQDIIAWEEVQPERFFDERSRIEDLCKWGKEFGIDGFARMEMDFEVMLCDFTAGVELVSFLYVRLSPKDKDHSPPSPPPLDPNNQVRRFEVMHSGSWHNRYPGDSRIVLDLTGLVSLYDIALAPSLVPVRAGLERWDHRVFGISSNDISKVMRKLTEVISRPHPTNSGLDWKTLIHVIVDRYANRLELMQYLLNFTSSDPQEVLERAKLAQIQLRVMVMPYLLDSTVVPSAGASGVDTLQWASPIFRLCATTHTSVMISQIPFMTPSEHLLLKAVEETTREICRVTTKMWAVGVMNGLDTLFPVELSGDPDVLQIMDDRRQDIEKLMSWLDWSIWIKCRPACGPEEMCYLPTWPNNAPGRRHPRQPPRDPQNSTGAPAEVQDLADRVGYPPEGSVIADEFSFIGTPEEWRKPQPKCIRRLPPYGF